MKEIEEYTVSELKVICKRKRIKGYSGKTKPIIYEMIREHDRKKKSSSKSKKKSSSKSKKKSSPSPKKKSSPKSKKKSSPKKDKWGNKKKTRKPRLKRGTAEELLLSHLGGDRAASDIIKTHISPYLGEMTKEVRIYYEWIPNVENTAFWSSSWYVQEIVPRLFPGLKVAITTIKEYRFIGPRAVGMRFDTNNILFRVKMEKEDGRFYNFSVPPIPNELDVKYGTLRLTKVEIDKPYL